MVREGTVLIRRRLARHGYGTWSFSGGRPAPGETPEGRALRELFEETALVGTAPSVIAETTDGLPDSHAVFHTRFVQVDATGDPELREPDKTAGWDWRPWHDLPSTLFLPIASFRATDYHPV
jgi:8-oxo-dGTP diphosphatase